MSRPNSTSTKNLELVDFFSKEELAIYHHDSQPSAYLKDIVGCDDIKTAMCQVGRLIKNCKGMGINFRDMLDFNYLFVGSPGTGKTTVARLMGKILYELGVLPTDEVVEKSASDFTTGFVGQTGENNASIFEMVRVACIGELNLF